jgi:hypothetical protein
MLNRVKNPRFFLVGVSFLFFSFFCKYHHSFLYPYPYLIGFGDQIRSHKQASAFCETQDFTITHFIMIFFSIRFIVRYKSHNKDLAEKINRNGFIMKLHIETENNILLL